MKQINYTARHTKLTPDIKKYCERRIQSLEKMLGYPVETDILLSVEKYRNKVEINLKTKGATLNTTEETHDMSSSLLGAFDHIERRVKKNRDKLREKKRRRTREAETYTPQTEPEERSVRLIRSQNFSMKPMSVEEAYVQLESSKGDVLMFRKRQSEGWAVIYRRKDGNFGLIDPE